MASSSTSSLAASPSSRLNRHRTRRHTRSTQHLSVQLPARFQGISEDEEDAVGEKQPIFQEKSLYGIIAQAEDFGKFKQRWQQNADSDSEQEQELGNSRNRVQHAESSTTSAPHSKVSSTSSSTKPLQRLSQSTILRPFLKSKQDKSESSAEDEDHMTQSQFLPPKQTPQTSRHPSSVELSSTRPMLDRRLEAQVKLERQPSTASRSSRREPPERQTQQPPRTLASVIADIFSFEEPEEIIAEYQCWYLQSVLLQGYLYITKKHVCFYAYLQKRAGHVLKSGHLNKRGKNNPRYRRYWFVLKGNVLSYYANAAQPYFPSGTVDLRYGISAEMLSSSNDPDGTSFVVTTDTRTYQFRADSVPSAQEWVKQLQKVIFRSHNESDSVKIAIPLDRIVDVEANPVIGSSDTVKLRVMDDETSFAIDEYFFTFFSKGSDALKVLNSLTQDNVAKKVLSQDDASNSLSPHVRSRSQHSRQISVSRGHNTAVMSPTGRTAVAQSAQSPSSDTVSPIDSPSLSIGTQRNIDMSASQILSGDAAFRPSTLPQAGRASLRSAESTTPAIQASRSAGKGVSRAESTSIFEKDGQKNKRHVTQDLQEPSARPASSSTGVDIGSDATATSRKPATTLQTAAAVAGYFRDQGKRVSSYLSGSPREYYDKFSGALAGGMRHYSEADGLLPEDRIDDEDEVEVAEHERRFRQHFALPDSERLLAVYFASLHRVLPLYGKVYISTHWFCFRSLILGTNTKILIPFRDIDNVEKERGFRIGYPGLVLVLRGHEELFLDFRTRELRDDCVVTILRNLDTLSVLEDEYVTDDEQARANEAAAEHLLLQEVRQETNVPELAASTESFDETSSIFEQSASVLDFKPKKSLRIVCLTIGSRGDVQPYIALCKGLIAEGHRPKIATHVEFGPWVTKHGIDFAPVGGNPAELMRLCVELGMFTPKFLYETNYKFRGWLDELLQSAWDACRDCDLLIESPSAMAGIHIAEALGVPYFRAFTMMWTRTRAYPHAFAAMNYKMGGTYNLTTYGLFESVFWQMTANQINRWRKNTLGIGPTTSTRMQQNKVPFLYNFSPSFVVPPLDYSDWVRVTGYWFLDEGTDWKPPADLLAFIKQARDDNMKLVYIGFGSVVVNDSKALTQSVVDAVVKADVRCILSKGWSDRLDAEDPNATDVPLPSCIFKIGSAPHDWLFKQVDAAVHHGGAGTTGASLRAGKPTIIRPFFGDQYFSAARVEDLGVGMRLKHLTPNVLGKALWIATHDDRMRNKARDLGVQIRAEDGVATAIKAIYRDMEYAKTLIKQKQTKAVAMADSQEEDEDAEESWTFVEADSDMETVADSAGGNTAPATQQTLRNGRYNLGALMMISRAG